MGTFRREFKPSFEYRWVCEGDWALHNRMNLWAPVNGQTVGVNWKWDFHTFRELIPPDKYFKAHPEWFALVKGKRQGITDLSGHDSQLCTSNPEVIEKLAQGLVETIQADPTIEVISLTPNDGGGFCECKNCEALDGPPRGRLQTASRGSKRNPGRTPIALRSWTTRWPGAWPNTSRTLRSRSAPMPITSCRRTSRTSGMEPNILVQICRFSPSRSIVEQWAALTDQLGVYQYYAVGNFGRYQLLRPLVHEMRSDIPWLRDRGVKEFYTQYMQQPWYQCPLNHYIAAKLAWNADLDVDWLVSDYCDKFFEKASGPMRDYLLEIEQVMKRYEKHGGEPPAAVAQDYDQATRDKLRSLLGQGPTTGGLGGGEERVAAIRGGFDACEYSVLHLPPQQKRKTP